MVKPPNQREIILQDIQVPLHTVDAVTDEKICKHQNHWHESRNSLRKIESAKWISESPVFASYHP
jgi:hypothetical protein